MLRCRRRGHRPGMPPARIDVLPGRCRVCSTLAGGEAMNRRLAILLICLLEAACVPAGPEGDAGTSDAGNTGGEDAGVVDAGPCEVRPGYETAGGCVGPSHRRTAETCRAAPSTECSPQDNSTAGFCAVDGDCATNACVDYYDGCVCGPADCVSDDDCDAEFACICRSSLESYRNACLPADCRVDADCPSGRCLLSLGGGNCCDSGQVLGLFCATPSDDCSSDADCEPGRYCAYDQALALFTCRDVWCNCD